MPNLNVIITHSPLSLPFPLPGLRLSMQHSPRLAHTSQAWTPLVPANMPGHYAACRLGSWPPCALEQSHRWAPQSSCRPCQFSPQRGRARRDSFTTISRYSICVMALHVGAAWGEESGWLGTWDFSRHPNNPVMLPLHTPESRGGETSVPASPPLCLVSHLPFGTTPVSPHLPLPCWAGMHRSHPWSRCCTSGWVARLYDK